MGQTDSELLMPTTLDHMLLALLCAAGIAAAGVQWFLGYPAVDLIALMLVCAAALVYQLNMRIVMVIRRQRKRKAGEPK